jgi:hypothetical protein
LATKIKVQKASKRFQHQRRSRRREKLLRLFVELHEEFEALIPSTTANISNLLSLADIFHHVDLAAGIIKRLNSWQMRRSIWTLNRRQHRNSQTRSWMPMYSLWVEGQGLYQKQKGQIN